MTILKINGREKEVPNGTPSTLAELLDKLNISQATVAAQIDGKIIKRGDFGQTKVLATQSIELLRLMGGG